MVVRGRLLEDRNDGFRGWQAIAQSTVRSPGVVAILVHSYLGRLIVNCARSKIDRPEARPDKVQVEISGENNAACIFFRMIRTGRGMEDTTRVSKCVKCGERED